jgi:hypothetical protein
MTSDEINVQLESLRSECKRALTLGNKDLARQYLSEVPLWEIAYQLAVMNERNDVPKLKYNPFGESLGSPIGADSDSPLRGDALRCSDCHERLGSYHKPSCHRQGTVTMAADYRDQPIGADSDKTVRDDDQVRRGWDLFYELWGDCQEKRYVKRKWSELQTILELQMPKHAPGADSDKTVREKAEGIVDAAELQRKVHYGHPYCLMCAGINYSAFPCPRCGRIAAGPADERTTRPDPQADKIQTQEG